MPVRVDCVTLTSTLGRAVDGDGKLARLERKGVTVRICYPDLHGISAA
jgi:hypothetical protein